MAVLSLLSNSGVYRRTSLRDGQNTNATATMNTTPAAIIRISRAS
jgi:hypothetical protein